MAHNRDMSRPNDAPELDWKDMAKEILFDSEYIAKTIAQKEYWDESFNAHVDFNEACDLDGPLATDAPESVDGSAMEETPSQEEPGLSASGSATDETTSQGEPGLSASESAADETTSQGEPGLSASGSAAAETTSKKVPGLSVEELEVQKVRWEKIRDEYSSDFDHAKKMIYATHGSLELSPVEYEQSLKKWRQHRRGAIEGRDEASKLLEIIGLAQRLSSGEHDKTPDHRCTLTHGQAAMAGHVAEDQGVPLEEPAEEGQQTEVEKQAAENMGERVARIYHQATSNLCPTTLAILQKDGHLETFLHGIFKARTIGKAGEAPKIMSSLLIHPPRSVFRPKENDMTAEELEERRRALAPLSNHQDWMLRARQHCRYKQGFKGLEGELSWVLTNEHCLDFEHLVM